MDVSKVVSKLALILFVIVYLTLLYGSIIARFSVYRLTDGLVQIYGTEIEANPHTREILESCGSSCFYHYIMDDIILHIVVALLSLFFFFFAGYYITSNDPGSWDYVFMAVAFALGCAGVFYIVMYSLMVFINLEGDTGNFGYFVEETLRLIRNC